jgi:predicted dehydrogenase
MGELDVHHDPVFGGYRDFGDTFRELLLCFVRQVADGMAPDMIDGSGADGLEALRVIEAGIRSLSSVTVVEVVMFS